MEITNEIKAKVFAQYLGQPMKCVGGHFIANRNSMRDGVKIMSLSVMADCYEGTFKWSDFKLLLKPLSQISDEDKAKLAKELGESVGPGYEHDLVYWGNFWVNKFLENEYMEVNKTVLIIQFLQSRGYDLPNYLLGGKTLNEAGLAVYETNNL